MNWIGETGLKRLGFQRGILLIPLVQIPRVLPNHSCSFTGHSHSFKSEPRGTDCFRHYPGREEADIGTFKPIRLRALIKDHVGGVQFHDNANMRADYPTSAGS